MRPPTTNHYLYQKTQPMKRLPLGIQEFGEFHRNDLLYVDKTEVIHRMVTSGKYYFLSRPRRFGKSLLANTIKELFRGKKEYFSGLWIGPHWDWQQVHPVVQIDFSMMGDLRDDLQAAIEWQMAENHQEYGLQMPSGNPGAALASLLRQLHQQTGQQVVVLIDEYDKPILDVLNDSDKLEAQREILKSFYSVLKGSDAHLRFVFLTGVSKFSQVSIFSGLNNLTDITSLAAYSQLLGITQSELESNFGPYLEATQKAMGMDRETLLAKIRHWYNGYSWDGVETLYNPYSLLSFFYAQKFTNFWFSSGTPTFLTKLLKKQFIYDLSGMELDSINLASLNVDDPSLASLLFQTGYLTIKDYDPTLDVYRLDYPNYEVHQAFTQWLMAEYAFSTPGDSQAMVVKLYRALQKPDFEAIREIFNALFALIPPHDFVENREKYYQSIIFLAMTLLGFYIEVEVPSGKGRLDAVVKQEGRTFLFEFKLDATPAEALAQIKSRNYAQRYLPNSREVYLLGVNLRSADKEVEELAVGRMK